METHVRIAFELVSRIAFLAGAAEIVLTHQGRYDGLGCLQGLHGNEIPLGARVFAVPDTSGRDDRRTGPTDAPSLREGAGGNEG